MQYKLIIVLNCLGDDVQTPMTLQASLPDGTILVNMNSFVYLGTPRRFNITDYVFNDKVFAFDVQKLGGFGCTQQVFEDVRRYLCISANGELQIRRGSDFKSIEGGSEIIIVISAYSEEDRRLAICKFTYRVAFRPTLVPPTTKLPSTTINATTKATPQFELTMSKRTLKDAARVSSPYNPRQYRTRVFESNTYDACKRAETQQKHLSTSCIGTKDRYITGRKNGSAVLFPISGDRVVRIFISRNKVKFPSESELIRFTLRQVLYGTGHKYGRQVSVDYNNTAQNLQKKSNVQLPLVLSFDDAFAVELSAVSYSRSSRAVLNFTPDSSGIRLHVHSLKATCSSSNCVAVYRSWTEESNKCGLDTSKGDDFFIHQYYDICLSKLDILF